MKNYKNFASAVMMFLAMSVSFVSCSKDDDGPIIEEGAPTAEEMKTAEGQTEYLEFVATKLFNNLTVADFAELQYVVEAAKEMDGSSVRSWAQDALDACVNLNSERIIKASAFTGHFTVNSQNEVVQESGTFDDVQIKFKDSKNQDCVLVIKAVGEKTKVFLQENDPAKARATRGRDVTQDYLMVPEKATATMTQAGKQVINIEIVPTLTLKGNTPNRLDPDVDEYTLDLSATFYGYTFAIKKAHYVGGTKTMSGVAEISISKGKDNLLNLKVDGSYNNTSTSPVIGGLLTISMVDRIKVVADIENIALIANALNELEKATTKADAEAIAKTLNQTISKCYIVYPYYGKDCVTKVEFGVQENESYFSLVPSLVYPDGSKMTIDQLLQTEEFATIMGLAQKTMEEFMSAVEGILGGGVE